MNDTVQQLTPATLYLRHWDVIMGNLDDLHRYQTINFTDEDTILIKKFLRGVKELSIRIGIKFDDETRVTGKYYLFLFDTVDNQTHDLVFTWPGSPKDLED